MESIRYGLIVLAVAGAWTLGACSDGGGDEKDPQSRDTAEDTYAPSDASGTDADAGGELCDRFCSQIDSCQLSIPSCRSRCGSYESEIRECVAYASDCSDIRECFGTPPDAGLDASDGGTDATDVSGDTGLDTGRDTSADTEPPSDTGDLGGADG